MSKKLTKEQQATWDRLNYVPDLETWVRQQASMYDTSTVNAMYPSAFRGVDVVLSIKQEEVDSEKLRKFRIYKNR